MAEGSGAANGRLYATQLYPRMLIDDVSLGVAPIGGQSSRPDFAVELVGADEDAVILVAEALGRGRGLTDSVCDFLHDCAQSLMVLGQVDYEIDYLAKEGTSEPLAFKLEPIPPGTISRSRGRLLQVVPQDVAIELGTPAEIELSEETYVFVRLPNEEETIRRDAMDDLSRLSGRFLPEFVLQRDPLRRDATGFDESLFIRARELALAAATSRIGWNAREILNEYLLEYYSLTRFLRFERFKLAVREEILKLLNRVVERAGDRFGFAAELQMLGLPTLQTIESAEKQLASGEGSWLALSSDFRLL